MNEIIYALPTGFSAFCATNLDDILILLLFFSQVHSEFKKRQIIAGQYLGFFALVIASLPGFLGGLFFPRPWIGLLGIIPFFIGLSRLLNGENEEPDEEEITTLAPSPLPVSFWGSLLSPQTYGVAAITFANGGDNISIYMPLFASSSWESLSIILGEFFLLVGVWCYTAYRLSRIKTFAETLTRYGNRLVPFVLMVLGILILIDSRTLENRGLTVLTLIISTGYFLTCQRHRLFYGLTPLFPLVKKDSPTT